jgi:hypothetical protein
MAFKNTFKSKNQILELIPNIAHFSILLGKSADDNEAIPGLGGVFVNLKIKSATAVPLENSAATIKTNSIGPKFKMSKNS